MRLLLHMRRGLVPLLLCVVAGIGTRALARYAHDCGVLQGEVRAAPGTTISGHAASHGTVHAVAPADPPCHSGLLSPDEGDGAPRHDHEACPLCQSIELSIAWDHQLPTAFVSHAAIQVEAVSPETAEPRDHSGAHSFQARAPPA